jgi:hypothetical protein
MVPAIATLDPDEFADDLRVRLDNRDLTLGFFFGAGSSITAGLPSMTDLTTRVYGFLDAADKAAVNRLMTGFTPWTIEHLLTRLRLLVAAAGTSGRRIAGFSPIRLRRLDTTLCSRIVDVIGEEDPGAIPQHQTLARWIGAREGARPVELFTLNYDLLLERSLEYERVPFFDGFIGLRRARFYEELLDEPPAGGARLPGWTKVWKLHGSLGWYLAPEGPVRSIGSNAGLDTYLIYPSIEKYASSRRLPFVALQDRFRRFLRSGDVVLVVCGYSWGDEHINDVIFRSLEVNAGLNVVAFAYDDPSDALVAEALSHRGLTAVGRRKLVRGGRIADWAAGRTSTYWDAARGWLLGDFSAFTSFVAER